MWVQYVYEIIWETSQDHNYILFLGGKNVTVAIKTEKHMPPDQYFLSTNLIQKNSAVGSVIFIEA